MNPTDIPLRDIHLPDAAGWWPPAPGWWLLAAALVIALVFAVRAWRRRRAWRRSAFFAATREFERLRTDWHRHRDTQRLARDMSTFLRRAAMSLRTRRATASLTGADWWRFLDEAAGVEIFGADGGRLITEAPYRAGADVDAERLLSLAERWLQAALAQRRSATP